MHPTVLNHYSVSIYNQRKYDNRDNPFHKSAKKNLYSYSLTILVAVPKLGVPVFLTELGLISTIMIRK